MTAPCPRELRARLFWVARWLLGGADYHTGPLEVVVRNGPEDQAGTALLMRPKPGDEIYDAENGPESGERIAAIAPKLLAALVTPDELKLLTAIRARQAVTAKTLIKATGIDRSRCYFLLLELRERGLIREGTDGYEIADRELWEAIRGSSTEERRAA